MFSPPSVTPCPPFAISTFEGQSFSQSGRLCKKDSPERQVSLRQLMQPASHLYCSLSRCPPSTITRRPSWRTWGSLRRPSRPGIRARALPNRTFSHAQLPLARSLTAFSRAGRYILPPTSQYRTLPLSSRPSSLSTTLCHVWPCNTPTWPDVARDLPLSAGVWRARRWWCRTRFLRYCLDHKKQSINPPSGQAYEAKVVIPA
jgi:hypothetical protein